MGVAENRSSKEVCLRPPLPQPFDIGIGMRDGLSVNTINTKASIFQTQLRGQVLGLFSREIKRTRQLINYT